MFEGLTVALVTPFRSGRVDEPALGGLVERLMDDGVDGFVATGSTGEAATLAPAERERVLSIVVERAKGRAFVVAGTGTNDTAVSIEFTRAARKLGADGAMLVTPYYNKPTHEGLVRHYEAVAQAVDLPIVVYNVPGRTGLSLKPETVERLAKIPGVVAIKEASGSLDQVSDIIQRCDLTVLSGDDSLTLPMLAVGARGIISVAGHVVPSLLKRMIVSFEEGDSNEARRLHHAIYPVMKCLFIETNPAPVKHALAHLKLIADELRLPLVPVSAGSATIIEETVDRVLAAAAART
jgi:4-hydroxy-tetrahydrodipicolinate synthase